MTVTIRQTECNGRGRPAKSWASLVRGTDGAGVAARPVGTPRGTVDVCGRTHRLGARRRARAVNPWILPHPCLGSTWMAPTGQPLPFPWRQSRRQRALVLAALACVALAILATNFGHAIARSNPLGPNQAIGTVVYAKGDSNSTFVTASYTPRDRPDSSAYAMGMVTHVISDGQTVLVRYDPNQPTDGTVLSQSTPGSGPDGLYGALVGALGFLGFGTLWVVAGFRKWRLYRAREAATDYRVGPWAGTTNSA